MRPKGSAADLEARRRRAVKLLAEGWSVSDVMAAVGASRAAVYQWKSAAGTRGERAKALAAKPQHVRQCRLSQKQKSKLVRLLRGGPRKAGFDWQLWTLPRVALLIEREFGVSYHSTHVGRLLHALGFSCQKPKRRSREQDPEAVKTWREQKWPAIKKGGR
jgi:transposase